MSKNPRDWNAVDAHFRRGGPMKHKNSPRGGAHKDEEIEDALSEHARQDPEPHVCRWVCLCGNLIKENPQHPQLPSQTLRAVGECCADVLPEESKHLAMPSTGIAEVLPQGNDQRTTYRNEKEPLS